MQRALAGNLDVAAEVSKIREARQQVIIAGAAALPHIDLSPSVNNTSLSKNAGLSQLAARSRAAAARGAGPGAPAPAAARSALACRAPTSPPTASASTPPGSSTSSARPGAASRRRVAGSRRRSGALRDAEVSAGLRGRRRLPDAALAAAPDRRRAARGGAPARVAGAYRARRRSGFATTLEVSQQQTQLRLGEVAAADAGSRGAGRDPCAGGADRPAARGPHRGAERQSPRRLRPRPRVPVGLPSELLRRRPDVRIAERNLAAATADVGWRSATSTRRSTSPARPT